MLFTRDGHNLFLGDMYRGRTAFLLCGGPSLVSHDLKLLQQRGVLTCAVNNAAAVFRPQLWVSVDNPGNFCDAIWRDPGILKFVPLGHMQTRFTVRGADDQLRPSAEYVGDMPAVFGFRRNKQFVAEQWLYEDTFNWGNHPKQTDAMGNTGSRSVMYVAVRLPFYLGIRRLYLLGCDFRMEWGKANYAFSQDRNASSVRGNNETYRVLNARLTQLLPYFRKAGYEVFNCTPDSGLTAFPYVPFEEAVTAAAATVPSRIVTAGMYDRVTRLQKAGKTEIIAASAPPAPADLATLVWEGEPGLLTLPDGLPELTLVVPWDTASLAVWPYTWTTWIRFHPWVGALPLLVIHADDVDLAKNGPAFLREHPQVRYAPFAAAKGSRHYRAARLIKASAEMVRTPWYVTLDPRLIACASGPGLAREWFASDARGRRPMWIAAPRSYTKPADTLVSLDKWAEGVPELSGLRRLELRGDLAGDRLQHPTISSWCLLADAEWTRKIAALTPEELPCAELGTYMHYCAERRDELGQRVPLRHYGWEYRLHSADRVVRRCREVLGLT
jgi:hypothetical protein